MTGEGFTGTLREGKEVLVKVQSEDAAWVANRLGNIGITGDTLDHLFVLLSLLLSIMLLSLFIIIIIYNNHYFNYYRI
jgi:hypothetical protein